MKPISMRALCLALCLVGTTSSCGGCDSSDAQTDGGSLGTTEDSGLGPDIFSGTPDAGTASDARALDDSGDTPDAAAPRDSDGDVGSTSGETGDTGDTGDVGSDDATTVDVEVANPAVCGDAVLDPGESCDDGVTTDCLNTHDGGSGSCVSLGTCSAGYVLDGTGACVANPTGLSTPCANGSGWTMFRFNYSNNSTSAQIDVWDASCSYSFAPNSACNVREVYPGFGEVSRTSDGYPIFTSSNYMRVRFSATGLNFTNATLWIRARSYATSSSTYYDAWSPLYGGQEGGPVDNDFTYDWYAMDWTGYLFPTDSPSLTAIQLYGGRGSGSLAVRSVELCVE